MQTVFASMVLNKYFTCPCTDGLAWDWVSEKLYWTDAENGTIEVLDPITGQRTILIITGGDTVPRRVVIDPDTRLEFIMCTPLKVYIKYRTMSFM